jgi:CO/xanthine dehydrogenase Mo-binding subunit
VGKSKSRADLASVEDAAEKFKAAVPQQVALTPVKEWKVMGVSTPRPNRRDLVTGKHQYPSDIVRPGMLFGKVLRPISYGAKLKYINLEPAKAMDGVVVVKDGDFIGVAAPSTHLANQALTALSKTALWDRPEHVASKDLFAHLEKSVRVPANPAASDLAAADKKLQVNYNVPYVQHSPMEPRAAVAEWDGDSKVTVWTATQNPFAVRGEVANALRVQQDGVRVIVPDFGGGFGGKHSGECAVEAARLAKAAGKPVSLRWTRAEEFTWAYFRPAAVIKAEAHLDGDGTLASWYFVNIDGDGSALQSPYRSAKTPSQQQLRLQSTVLRHGSYRALGSTANNFARESFVDELAELAGKDPLEFRLAHLPNDRLRAVLQEAAKRFDWSAAREKKQPNRGVGLACGTEKGSYVAACAEVEIDPKTNEISIRRATEVFECGAIVNPENLRTQVLGALIMGLGPALREEMTFENGQITNAAFSKYSVPRFDDVPQLDIHLLDRADLASAGAGETPIIAIAPAIANAVFHATGQRIREMPIRLAAAKS